MKIPLAQSASYTPWSPRRSGTASNASRARPCSRVPMPLTVHPKPPAVVTPPRNDPAWNRAEIPVFPCCSAVANGPEARQRPPVSRDVRISGSVDPSSAVRGVSNESSAEPIKS